VSVQNPAGRGDTAVRRTRAVLFATVALTMLAISPAVQATDGFENVGSGYYSPSASTLGISADGRVVFGNGFVGYSRGWTSARDWAEVGGGVRLPAWNNRGHGLSHRIDHTEPDHDLRLAPRRRAGILRGGLR
jgi:hypothetical protein